jgi:hypothetical protein
MLNRSFLCLTALTLVVSPWASALPFNLGRVANTPLKSGTAVSIQVTTLGAGSITGATNWTVHLSGPMKFTGPPTSVAFDNITHVATLTLPLTPFGTDDPAKFSWSVEFQDGKQHWAAQQAPALADSFSLFSSSGKVKDDNVEVTVYASGIPPAGSELTNPAYWRVQGQDTDGNTKVVQPVKQAAYSFLSNAITLTLPASAVSPVNTAKASWTALFLPPDMSLMASPGSQKAAALSAAKGRDDADLYASGGYIAGLGTKPIMILDIKAGYSDSLENYGKLLGGKSSATASPPAKHPNLRLGFYGEFNSNVGAMPPSDRTRLDPDSVLGYTTLSQSVALKHNPLLYSLKWEIQPVGGEFARSSPESNFISGGRIRFLSELVTKKSWGLDLIPSVGFEGGKNLNHPSMLFSRPVDLSRFNGIARLRGGANANLYIYRKLGTPGDDYSFTFTGSWIARVPFTAEPFTTSAYLPDPTMPANITRQSVVNLRTNTRHYVEADAVWNVSKLFGFSATYKYGSLPPLFEFVDHQVSLGVLFKATYTHNHSVTNPLK